MWFFYVMYSFSVYSGALLSSFIYTDLTYAILRHPTETRVFS